MKKTLPIHFDYYCSISWTLLNNSKLLHNTKIINSKIHLALCIFSSSLRDGVKAGILHFAGFNMFNSLVGVA